MDLFAQVLITYLNTLDQDLTVGDLIKILKPSNNERSSRGQRTENRLVSEINENIGLGGRVRIELETINAKSIKKAETIGGTKRKDIKITFMDNSTKTIELKTTNDKWTSLESSVNPLKVIPQYLQINNGFQIREEYIKTWYEYNISSGNLRREFSISDDVPTPTFDEWKSKDASMGEPNTKFSLKLKEIVKNSSDMDKKLKKIKASFSDIFRNKLKEKEDFQEIMNKTYNVWKTQTIKSFSNKDYWVLIPEYINWSRYKLFKKIDFPEEDMDCSKLTINNTSKDFVINVDHPLFTSIRIRWQNRIGIANVSVQCK